MKKLLFIIGAVLVTSLTSAQVKDSFELRSIPNYDLDGNLYIVVKRYDHLPTRQDSLAFELISDMEIRRMMEEVERMKQIKKNKARILNDKANRSTKRGK